MWKYRPWLISEVESLSLQLHDIKYLWIRLYEMGVAAHNLEFNILRNTTKSKGPLVLISIVPIMEHMSCLWLPLLHAFLNCLILFCYEVSNKRRRKKINWAFFAEYVNFLRYSLNKLNTFILLECFSFGNSLIVGVLYVSLYQSPDTGSDKYLIGLPQNCISGYWRRLLLT